MKKNIKYILLANPNGYKAGKVLGLLLEDKFFTSQNCIVVTTQNEGNLATLSRENNIEVVIVEKNKLEEVLSEYTFDFLISCGWNFKISESVINMAKIASINCHSSYLPDYKGAAAHKHAWANAEKFTGTTIHLLTSQFDGGNIIEQSKIKISFTDTPNTLIKKIALKTSELIPKAIFKLENNDFGISQNNSCARYFFKTSNNKFLLLRIVNLFLKPLRLTIYTKYKKV